MSRLHLYLGLVRASRHPECASYIRDQRITPRIADVPHHLTLQGWSSVVPPACLNCLRAAGMSLSTCMLANKERTPLTDIPP